MSAGLDYTGFTLQIRHEPFLTGLEHQFSRTGHRHGQNTVTNPISGTPSFTG